MHEFSVCRQLIKQLKSVMEQNQAIAIDSVTLRIGVLSGVDAALLQQAFPFAAENTVAADAKLIIETSDVVVLCHQCGACTPTRPNKLLCGECGADKTRLISGDEMLLVSVELIQADVHDHEVIKESGYV